MSSKLHQYSQINIDANFTVKMIMNLGQINKLRDWEQEKATSPQRVSEIDDNNASDQRGARLQDQQRGKTQEPMRVKRQDESAL